MIPDLFMEKKKKKGNRVQLLRLFSFFFFWEPVHLKEIFNTNSLDAARNILCLLGYQTLFLVQQKLKLIYLVLQFNLHAEILENNVNWITHYSFSLLFPSSEYIAYFIITVFLYISLVLFKRWTVYFSLPYKI